MPDFWLVLHGNYDAYVDRMKEVAENLGVSYYDFNLCKEEYLDLNTNDFADYNHLNTNGSTVFCHLFGEFFYGKLNRTDKIFYESYEEKISNMEDIIFGLVLDPIESNQELKEEYDIVPVTNIGTERITYTIINHILNENGEEEQFIIVQEDLANTRFDVSSEKTRQVEIYAYMDDVETNHIFLIIDMLNI